MEIACHIGPQREKICLRGFANNTGADQPAHTRSLISAFVIRFLQSTICKLATDEISIFYLVSVAEETVLKLAFSETPKTGPNVSLIYGHEPRGNVTLVDTKEQSIIYIEQLVFDKVIYIRSTLMIQQILQLTR